MPSDERYQRPTHGNTVADIEAGLLDLLYAEDGFHKSLMSFFDRDSERSGRSRVIQRGNVALSRAVFAQTIDESGFVSLTVGETENVIADRRWDYRILVPGPTERINVMHTSEHSAGRQVNQPPMIRFTDGTTVYPDNATDRMSAYAKLYVLTLHRAIEDMTSVSH